MKASSVVLLAFVFLLGCEKIEETPPADGEPVSATAIQDEFSKVESQINPIAAKVGDSLSLLLNMSVENSENFQNFAVLQRLVLERNATAKGIDYKIQNVDHKVNEDNSTEEVRNEICTLSLSAESITYKCPSDSSGPASKSMAFEKTQEQLKTLLNNKVGTMAEGDKEIDYRYYNLKTAEEVVPPPQVVQEREGCSGLSPCEIRLHHVQFLQLIRYASGKSRRLLWDYALTPDLIYLGKEGVEYKTCVSESITQDDRPYLIKQCLFVYDLIKHP